MLYVALFILAVLAALASFFMMLRVGIDADINGDINDKSEYVVAFFTTTTILSIVAAAMFFHEIFWHVG